MTANHEYPVVRLDPGDWEGVLAIARLDRALFPAEAFGAQPLALLGHAGWLYRQVDDGETDIAYAVVLPTMTAGRAFLASIGVLPTHRRQGRAQALMQRIMADLQGAGFKELTLTVAPTNTAAVTLYRDKLGFTLAGELFDHFGRGEDRLSLLRRIGGR